jgi:hypothetical protein
LVCFALLFHFKLASALHCTAAAAVCYRHREFLIAVVAQVLCLSIIITNIIFCDQQLAPYLAPLRAALTFLPTTFLSAAMKLCTALQHAVLHYLGFLHQHEFYQVPVVADATSGTSTAATAAAVQDVLCRALVVPESPMRAFWKLRGELLVIGAMPIAQNIRLRWHVPSILLEMAAMVYTFALVFPLKQVLLRFGVASGLSVFFSWAMDWNARKDFMRAAAAAAGQAVSSSSA